MFQVPVSEQELKGKKKKEIEKSSKSGDEKDGEKSQASACEGKVSHITYSYLVFTLFQHATEKCAERRVGIGRLKLVLGITKVSR